MMLAVNLKTEIQKVPFCIYIKAISLFKQESTISVPFKSLESGKILYHKGTLSFKCLERFNITILKWWLASQYKS